MAVLMALLSSTPALAVVDPYEVLTITPAEGQVDSLQHFTITFAGLPVKVDENAVPTLQKGGGNTIEGTMRADDDGTTVVIDFDQCCTASGHYFLNLPEGSLTVNGQRLLPLSLRFIIQGDMDSFYEQITIKPDQGVLESIKSFTISFPEYIGETTYGSRALLTNTTTGNIYHAEIMDVGYNALVYFTSEITEPGDYTLTIPAGSLVFYSLSEAVRELNFHFTIEGAGPSFYDLITIDPEPGTVNSLQRFTVTFPVALDGIAPGAMATLTNAATGTTAQTAIVADGNKAVVEFDQPFTQTGRYTLTLPAGAVLVGTLDEEVHELNFTYTIAGDGMPDYTINPPEGELYILQYFTIAYGQKALVNEDVHPTVTNDDTGDTYECNMMEIGGNAVIYMEYPTSVLGNYTLAVPAGCITIESTGQTNPEMTFHYVIVEKEIYIPPVIEEQPEGTLKLYRRSGSLVREVEKQGSVGEGENPYEIVHEQQDGVLSFVFAPDNKVYIQRPVSWTYYDGWIEGTLSDDGKTITVPMGQYVAYTKSLEMAIQVAAFSYDEALGSYRYDDSVTELTYTINGDSTITLNGTSEKLVLGTMNRAFGQNFQYLDYEWLQTGDYASIYYPINEMPLMPPPDMEIETYYLTTASNDGSAWDPYRATVNVGFEGDNMWIQGISQFVPKAWIKGVSVGNKVTFSNPQLLGTNDVLFYFKCAAFNPLDGSTTQQDMVLTVDELGDFKTFDYIFITTDQDNLYFVNYYQGLTLSRYPDLLYQAPADLTVEEYDFSYLLQYNPSLPPVEQTHRVLVGFNENLVYIQGIWPKLPQAWVVGKLVDGNIVMNLPQYMGRYTEEYSGTYPIYLNTFDKTNGAILPQIVFNLDSTTRAFSNATAPLSIGINKTGYLSIQDMSNLVFTPVSSSVEELKTDTDGPVEYYDLQGRRLNDISSASGIVIIKKADGTVTKVLKH